MGLECQILLEKATPNYFPGEIIQGRIVVINDQPRNVKGLKLKFEGKGTVKFSEMRQQRRLHNYSSPGESHHQHTNDYETVKVEYSSEEKYLDYTLEIFGNDGCERLIPFGRYEYPFQFTLPSGLPSSYDGSHGKITYKINAILPRSWAFDCKTSTGFYVSGILDLNIHPEAQQDVVLKKYKNLGWFFSKGDIGFLFKMPRRGLAVGGTVPFIIEMNNKSSKIVKPSISIYQEVKFFAQGENRSVTEKIWTVLGPELPAGADEVWNGNSLQIPFVPPTKLGGASHIIDINYTLKIKLSAPGLFSDLETQTPVVIGNIPFRFGPVAPHDPPPPYQPRDSELEDSEFALICPIKDVSPIPSAPSAPSLHEFNSV